MCGGTCLVNQQSAVTYALDWEQGFHMERELRGAEPIHPDLLNLVRKLGVPGSRASFTDASLTTRSSLRPTFIEDTRLTAAKPLKLGSTNP